MEQCELPHRGEYIRPRSLLHNRCTEGKKKNGPKKEQIKAPEKIQLSDEEIVNLSGAEFKTPVIRMLTEMVE